VTSAVEKVLTSKQEAYPIFELAEAAKVFPLQLVVF
jgi:hypothetical protein